MKQYNRGIAAYKAASTGTLTKTKPVVEDKKLERSTTGLIKVTKEDKYSKVAKLLLVLNRDEAAKVLTDLPAGDIEKISRKISKIDRVGKSEAFKILSEFGKESDQYNRNQGGVETARSILTQAFGQDRGNELLYKAVPDIKDEPFAFLKDLDFNQRMMVLRKESVSVLTVIFSYLPGSYSSPIIEALSPEKRKDIIKRLSKVGRISPQVINIISENLTEKIKALGTIGSIDIDGTGTLAEILKHMDRSGEERILGELKSEDSNLVESIRDRLYTIDIIDNIDARDLQVVLQELSEEELIYLVKGEALDIQEKILKGISSGRRTLVEAEMEIIGLVKKSDADKMTKKFIGIIRDRVEEGKITLLDDDLIY